MYMHTRPSSEARFFGYRLLSERLPESDNPAANGWCARVVDPDGKPITFANLDGPFDSQLGAELYAENIARRHSEIKDFLLPIDEHPTWELLQNG
jgi:hypothetical protein